MISKIISGGQTGVDQAALDAAIEFDIPHGGWIPKGRKTENGLLPEKYKLNEMPTASYPKRTEQNVIDSHGTLIISRGKLNGGSALTQKLAEKQNRPCLHIDLNKINAFMAAVKINNWIYQYAIEILNVAGPRASKEPGIYQVTVKLLKTLFYMATIDANMDDPGIASKPKTVDEAVERLIKGLTLSDRTHISRMQEDDLHLLNPVLGSYIREHYGLNNANSELMKSCLLVSGMRDLQAYSKEVASAI